MLMVASDPFSDLRRKIVNITVIINTPTHTHTHTHTLVLYSIYEYGFTYGGYEHFSKNLTKSFEMLS